MRTLYDPTLRNYFERCRRLLGPARSRTRGSRVPSSPARSGPCCARSGRSSPNGTAGSISASCCGAPGAIPSRFPDAVRLGIKGFHFEAITREALACNAIRHDSTRVAERFRPRLAQLAEEARHQGASEAERIRALVAERARALRRLRRRIRKLAPDTRAAAATAYGDALKRINDLFAEHAPSAAGAFEAGSRRLATLKTSVRRDVDRIRARYVEARERAGRGAAELGQELRSLYRMRRDALKRARRRVRRLPREYRLFGALELQALRRRLDDLLPEPGTPPVPA